MAGEVLPIMPVDHPLTFFKPYLEFALTLEVTPSPAPVPQSF